MSNQQVQKHTAVSRKGKIGDPCTVNEGCNTKNCTNGKCVSNSKAAAAAAAKKNLPRKGKIGDPCTVNEGCNTKKCNIVTKKCVSSNAVVPVVKDVPTDDFKEIHSIVIDFDILDKSTHNYTKLLQEYDLSLLIGGFREMYKKNTGPSSKKPVAILDTPGNLDLKDQHTGFGEYLEAFFNIKKRSKKNDAKALTKEIREAANSTIEYLLTGAHPKNEKKFKGLVGSAKAMVAKALPTATSGEKPFRRGTREKSAKTKKPLQLVIPTTFIGILSLDIVFPNSKTNKPRGCGTQHYIAYVFDAKTGELFLFDSATNCKNFMCKTEIYYLLLLTFEEFINRVHVKEMGKKPSISIHPLNFKHILQPGAGDSKNDAIDAYPNQNVFCHTWSLWFTHQFIRRYAGVKPEDDSSITSTSMTQGNVVKDPELSADPGVREVILSIQADEKYNNRSLSKNLSIVKSFGAWILENFIGPTSSEQAANLLKLNKMKIKKVRKSRIFAEETEDDSKLSEPAVKSLFMKRYPFIGMKYVWDPKRKVSIQIHPTTWNG